MNVKSNSHVFHYTRFEALKRRHMDKPLMLTSFCRRIILNKNIFLLLLLLYFSQFPLQTKPDFLKPSNSHTRNRSFPGTRFLIHVETSPQGFFIVGGVHKWPICKRTGRLQVLASLGDYRHSAWYFN
ncbi:hypothetical protein K1719_004227 [Acacia pycnantha]|nr:hypothetical protein K1719_004227 [Acacia pycnantha]